MMPELVNGQQISFESPGRPKIGSVLLLLYPKDGQIFLPLMKRPDYDGTHGGQVSFPGGKREENDKSLIETALREGHEEVGIVMEDVKLLGNLSQHYITASNFKVLPVVGYVNYAPSFIPDRYEVEEVLEVNLGHLLNKNTLKKKEILVRKKYNIVTPYFDVDGHVVWGATAMMLSEFLTLIKSDYLK
jgi:8-oxo-dGTP pyrophosphatase MutT (NUDIX family)